MAVISLVEYLDPQGRSAHAEWFEFLNAAAAAKVAAALYQLAAGNFSNVKGIGSGVFERRIDFGPGYRLYFGKDRDRLVILLGGSSKRRRQKAIAQPKRAGASTGVAKREPQRRDNGTDTRFQGNHPGSHPA